ncbi:hypothetical protein FY528_08835 [Hymenobacter lutimineralis]|uniref:Uncharacterized protein n=1 Tax=Hymenobacter lutimineralis TaxID=2606448 RepID=A0A5D6V3C5_9BACT|nr:hypothetical protein [Hymenobacter lutimineralis]TYZ10561.1 hypothetical protein FY528_08835 [Hymenobacter lutimineralis]
MQKPALEFLNFSLDDQYIGLEWPKNGYADLHNNFNFTQLQYVPSEAKLILCWTKSSGDWAKKVPWQKLELLFSGVSYFHVKERDAEYPISEDDCLRDICRAPMEARGDFDNIWLDRNPPLDYDLQLVFQSEWGIKVNAATVMLKLEQ